MNVVISRKDVEEMVVKCQTSFSEVQRHGGAAEARKAARPPVMRVLNILRMIFPLVGQIREKGLPQRALEVGTGYGELILSAAQAFPMLEWSGVEHQGRSYFKDKRYHDLFRQFNCRLEACDLVRQPLPFPDGHFSIVTFSEVLEHLPLEKVPGIIQEMQRVLCPGGWLIASSPNLVSLNNRIDMLRGYSIFAPAVPLEAAGGTFGHIHLYTAEEFVSLCKPLACRQMLHESRFLQYKKDKKLWRTAAYKICRIVELLSKPVTKKLADTWYVVLQKTNQPGFQVSAGVTLEEEGFGGGFR